MDMHSLVSGVVGTVNPFIDAQLSKSTGYTTAPNMKRTPAYADPVAQQIQVQALSAKELQHLDGLNITGVLRKVYLSGDWQSVYRPGPVAGGGDIFSFKSTPAAVAAQNWLVVTVLETWPDWCSLAVQLQKG
ncbi:conserved protein of unknown function [Pararobbsia alpina]|uniref:hypothetical protein n=1 Tax=Pararobbsia alpina TaxID=621374 RepID=UPI0039A753F8